MRVKLWIDDERNEPNGWLRVSDAANAIAILDEYLLDISDISFDYDIGTTGNGATVARHLAAKADAPHYKRWALIGIKFNIHRANPPGVQEIASILQTFSKDVTYLPAKEMWKLHGQEENQG